MRVGLTALVAAGAAGLTMAEADRVQIRALQGVLFYLAAYGIMNAGAFGVLMLLPSRAAGAPDAAGRYGPPPATSAETFEDLAGQGRRYPLLGLAMTVCCLSLIGIPLTIGFFGKFYLLQPAWGAKLSWLVIITVVNAAISAAYYLRIIAAMYLRDDPATAEAMDSDIADAAEHARATHRIGRRAFPIVASIAISVALTLLFGIILPATNALSAQVRQAAMPEGGIPRLPVPPGTDDDHGAAPATQPAPAAAAMAR
jgi:NADH:ubiquinone oxidoreductase subunit 2 (subunit N)